MRNNCFTNPKAHLLADAQKTARLPRVLIALIASVLLSGCFGGSSTSVEDMSELHIYLNGSLPERTVPLVEGLTLGQERGDPMGLFDARRLLLRASKDERIVSVVLHLNNYTGGLSTSEDIGSIITTLRAKNKSVTAVAEYYGAPSQYLLASYADRILTTVEGGYLVSGMTAGQIYMAKLLNEIGVEVFRFHTGPFKTAGESQQHQRMSEANRLQLQQLIDSRWENYLQVVAENRNLEVSAVRETSNPVKLAQKYQGDMAQAALGEGMVDALLPRYDSDPDDSSSVWEAENTIDGWRYWHAAIDDDDDSISDGPEHVKIGVINVYGAIIGNAMDAPDATSPKYVLGQLDSLASEVDVLVLRVNSPGGAVGASEDIRQAFFKATEDMGKKAYVHMGNVAASGGYWVSMLDGGEIWASRFTVTGSVGVVGVIFGFGQTLDKLNAYYDGVQTRDAFAAGFPFTAIPDNLKTLAGLMLNNYYQRFLNLVSQQRNIPYEEVQKLAQGRVWDAHSALEHKLIDRTGSLNDLLEHIRKEEKAETYSTTHSYEKLELFQYLEGIFQQTPLIQLLSARTPSVLLLQLKKAALPLWLQLQQQLENPEGVSKPGFYLWCETCP